MSVQTETITPVRRLLRFPFAEPDWRTPFLIGTGLIWASYVVPLAPLVFVYGYALRVMRQTIDGRQPTLPPWDDWGAIGRDGLFALVIGLVYLLPALIIFSLGFFIYMFAIIGQPFLGALIDDPGAAAGVTLLGIFGAMAALFLAMFLGFVLSLAGFIPLPAAVAHALAQENLGAAFRFRHIWRLIRADAWSYFSAWIIGGGLSMLTYLLFMAGYYTFILICFMPFLVAPFILYAMLISAAVFGESYRQNASLLPANAGDN